MSKCIYFVLAFFMVSCGKTSQKEQQKQGIKVAYAKPISKGNERSYTFLSVPYRTTELSFRVGGPVTTFDVQNGQFFKKGELIASIDDRDFIIRKQKAEALFHQAKADYVRVGNLYQKGNISGTSYEKAKADYEKAKADFNTASNELKDTRLIAPFDGYVQKINIDKYQDVAPSYPILTFIDLSKVKAETYIPEDLAVCLRSHDGLDSVFVQFKAIGNKKFYPTETFLTQSTSDNNISYLYTVVLANSDNSLLGGMSGTLSVTLPKTSTNSSSMVAIPQAAVCHNPQMGTYVWLVGKDNKVNRQKISIGNLLSGNTVEVLSGLSSGDKIAVTRLSYLSDNETVVYEM